MISWDQMDDLARKKILPYFKIIRPQDDLIVGLIAIMAVILGGSLSRNMHFLTYFYILLAGIFLSAHAMVVNDIIDFEIDLINEPKRMLPSGKMSIKNAKIYSVLLGFLGVLFGLLIDFTDDIDIHFSWLWALFHLLIADLYNFKLKKTGFIGNLVVAYTGLASFLYGDLFFNGTLTLLPFTFGIITFSGNLSREILKGIIDVEGDSKHSVNTIAVRFSPSVARNISFTLLVVCMSLTGIIFAELKFIGQLGIFIFLANFSFALRFIYHSIDTNMARKGKHFILLGPFLLIPFILIDRILATEFI